MSIDLVLFSAQDELPALVHDASTYMLGLLFMILLGLKLPLAAIVIATALTISGGPSLVPLIIIGVVTAYLATLALEGRLATGDTAADSNAATAAST